jgi:SAC3 family protein LENG8/THP3
MEIEKNFLRITEDVTPDKVRPEFILHKAYKMIHEKFSKNKNYEYACEQLKSIRQDLTVQRIKNSFTVKGIPLNKNKSI